MRRNTFGYSGHAGTEIQDTADTAIGQLLLIAMVQAKECGLSRATIEHYRNILEDNYIVSAVYPEEDGTPIVYFNDIGLRNRLISLFHKPEARIERDNLLNNFLYKNLTTLGGKINYLRTERTDRVIFKFNCNNASYLLAVLYDFPQRKSGRRGLVSLAGRIKPKKVIILTKDYYQYEKTDGVVFIYLPATMAWLLPEIISVYPLNLIG
jgi:predicted AAA+ superfamily ATPase